MTLIRDRVSAVYSLKLGFVIIVAKTLRCIILNDAAITDAD